MADEKLGRKVMMSEATLEDFFASMFVAGLLIGEDTDGVEYRHITHAAYDLAEAMVEEREERKTRIPEEKVEEQEEERKPAKVLRMVHLKEETGNE